MCAWDVEERVMIARLHLLCVYVCARFRGTRARDAPAAKTPSEQERAALGNAPGATQTVR